VISLDKDNLEFADEMERLGYVPVSDHDIADEPGGEGQEVFTIGFPSSTAIVQEISHHPAFAQWASSVYSLPVASFGRVSMLHKALPFFWADMSIYPGNSGGPVVEKDRLVGIVSGNATVPMEEMPNVEMRIPFACVIKTAYVSELLDIQKQKDGR
jgi:S1-C subfamily serine protease